MYWRGRIHPLGRIGGYKRLRALPCTSQNRPAKIRSPPRDPRVATDPDDYGVKESKPSKQKLCKRRQASDPATDLQANFDKRQRTAEFFHAVNKQAQGKPLSAALQAARARDPRTLRDEPGKKKAAQLGQNRVAVKQNDKADRARLNTHDGGCVDKIDVCTADHGL